MSYEREEKNPRESSRNRPKPPRKEGGGVEQQLTKDSIAREREDLRKVSESLARIEKQNASALFGLGSVDAWHAGHEISSAISPELAASYARGKQLANKGERLDQGASLSKQDRHDLSNYRILSEQLKQQGGRKGDLLHNIEKTIDERARSIPASQSALDTISKIPARSESAPRNQQNPKEPNRKEPNLKQPNSKETSTEKAKPKTATHTTSSPTIHSPTPAKSRDTAAGTPIAAEKIKRDLVAHKKIESMPVQDVQQARKMVLQRDLRSPVDSIPRTASSDNSPRADSLSPRTNTSSRLDPSSRSDSSPRPDPSSRLDPSSRMDSTGRAEPQTRTNQSSRIEPSSRAVVPDHSDPSSRSDPRTRIKPPSRTDSASSPSRKDHSSFHSTSASPATSNPRVETTRIDSQRTDARSSNDASDTRKSVPTSLPDKRTDSDSRNAADSRNIANNRSVADHRNETANRSHSDLTSSTIHSLHLLPEEVRHHIRWQNALHDITKSRQEARISRNTQAQPPIARQTFIKSPGDGNRPNTEPAKVFTSSKFVSEKRFITGAEIALAAIVSAAGIARNRQYSTNQKAIQADKEDRLTLSPVVELNVGLAASFTSKTKIGKETDSLPQLAVRALAAIRSITNNAPRSLPVFRTLGKSLLDLKDLSVQSTTIESICAVPSKENARTASCIQDIGRERPTMLISIGDTLTGIAETIYHDRNLGWLIADLNVTRVKDSRIDGKRIVEFKNHQQIVLPVWEDVIYFYETRPPRSSPELLITIVVATAIDRELLESELGTMLGGDRPKKNRIIKKDFNR